IGIPVILQHWLLPRLYWRIPLSFLLSLLLFFFQAEDGIRDLYVTGVQTCALPIFPVYRHIRPELARGEALLRLRVALEVRVPEEIGRASCRERVCREGSTRVRGDRVDNTVFLK